jgi:hypothetical protein
MAGAILRGFMLLAACRLVSTGASTARVSTISPRPSSLISRSVGYAERTLEPHAMEDVCGEAIVQFSRDRQVYEAGPTLSE